MTPEKWGKELLKTNVKRWIGIIESMTEAANRLAKD
jgi:hypothetical protein